MTAQDYSINFPYGATDPPYGTPSLPYHRGEDRPCPRGTPVVINGVTIGLTGDTPGPPYCLGPHLHIQEWQGNVVTTRKPCNSFIPGAVVATGNASQWGNYVTIRNADGWNTTYCHLSRIDVRGGQIIGAPAPNPPKGGDMAEKITVDTSRILTHGVQARNGIMGRKYSLNGQDGGDELIGKDLTNGLIQQLFLSEEGRQWRDTAEPTSVSGINKRLQDYTVLSQQPPQVVEKIVEKPVEVIKEVKVEVPAVPSLDTYSLGELLAAAFNKLFKVK